MFECAEKNFKINPLRNAHQQKVLLSNTFYGKNKTKQERNKENIFSTGSYIGKSFVEVAASKERVVGKQKISN